MKKKLIYWLYRKALRFVMHQHELWVKSKRGEDGHMLYIERQNFYKAEFEGCNFKEARFSRCGFSQSSFTDIDFHKAYFVSSRLGQITLRDCISEVPDMGDTQFIQGDWSKVRLKQVDITKTVMRMCKYPKLHANNEEKAQLEAMKRSASFLWLSVDIAERDLNIKNYVLTPEQAKVKYCVDSVTTFLEDNKVRRPKNEGISSPSSHTIN